MSEVWDLCGNCLIDCFSPESFALVLSTGQCNCPNCKHQAHFDATGKIGHMAPSNAHAVKERRLRPK